ncbi:MAG: diguanylate cyclase [Syntrophomonas sp.]|nr:diguanylate cyclase [Syntrophomonas sp.]
MTKAEKSGKNVLEDQNSAFLDNYFCQEEDYNFISFFDKLDHLIFITDINANIKKANRIVSERLGYSGSELLGKNLIHFYAHEDHNNPQKIITGEEEYGRIPLLCKTGKLFYAETRGFKQQWRNEEILVVICKDISDLMASEEKFSRAFHSKAIMMIITSRQEGRLTDVNEKFCDKMGFKREEVIGRTTIELGIFKSKYHREQVISRALSSEKADDVEIRFMNKNRLKIVALFFTDIIKINNEEYLLSIITEITKRRKMEEELRLKNRQLNVLNQMLEIYASTDGVTNIYNHRYIIEKLQFEVERIKRYPQPLSILLLDIDHFKKVNDNYGHPTGDQVLRGVADIIKANLREVDQVGRYGGEEYLAILPQTEKDCAFQVAERIRHHIEKENFTDNGIKITISIGVAQYKNEGLEIFVNRADERMYLAKTKGRNRVEV